MRGLYKITNKLTGKIYIGQTRNVKRRWLEHKAASRLDSPKTHIDRTIKNYGEDSFICEHIATAKTKYDANCAETQLIAQYSAMDEKFGYNRSPGGDRFSDETCQEISDRYKGDGNPFFGRHHSEESRKKISQNGVGFSGKKHSNETLLLMSKVKVGIIFSDEHKSNISKARRGKKQSSDVIKRQSASRRKLTDEQEDNIRNDTRTAKQVAEEYGVKISLVKKVRSTVGRNRFKKG